MTTLATITDNYIGDERKFKASSRKYFGSIVRDLNTSLKLDFELKDIQFFLDTTIDIEAVIGNEFYNFLVFMYINPIDLPNTMYRAIRLCSLIPMPEPKVDLPMSATTNEIAAHLITFVDPRDIIKYRRR
jgi:hypothetical protein